MMIFLNICRIFGEFIRGMAIRIWSSEYGHPNMVMQIGVDASSRTFSDGTKRSKRSRKEARPVNGLANCAPAFANLIKATRTARPLKWFPSKSTTLNKWIFRMNRSSMNGY